MKWDICNAGTIENIFTHKYTKKDNVLITDPKPISNDFAVLMNKKEGVEVVVKIDGVYETKIHGQVITVRVGDPQMCEEKAIFEIHNIETLIRM